MKEIELLYIKDCYIRGKKENFKETELFNGRIRVLLPDSFIDMPEFVRMYKYSTSYQPQIIKTNYDNSVNFVFSILDNPYGLSSESIANAFRLLLYKINPATIFNDKQTQKCISGTNISYFDFTKCILDKKIYNLVCIITFKEKILYGMFNCLEYELWEWKEVAKEVFLNLKIVK